MNKSKIGIISLILIVVIGLGVGFNSIFSKAKDESENKIEASVASEELVSKDKENKEEKKSEDTKDKKEESKEDKEKDESKEDNKSEETDKKNKEDSNKNEESKDTDSEKTNSNKNDSTNKNESTSNSNSNKNESTTQNKPQSNPSISKPKTKTVTVSISCKTAINNKLNKEPGFTHLPSSGIILSSTTVEIEDGDTVLDVLVKVTRKRGIHMEYSGAGSSAYIEGINNLYEFDGGSGSGWMYNVNGIYPNYGAGAYKIKNNDVIRWNYTCNLGADLGAKR